jgi:hypothetical protein
MLTGRSIVEKCRIWQPSVLQNRENQIARVSCWNYLILGMIARTFLTFLADYDASADKDILLERFSAYHPALLKLMKYV